MQIIQKSISITLSNDLDSHLSHCRLGFTKMQTMGKLKKPNLLKLILGHLQVQRKS